MEGEAFLEVDFCSFNSGPQYTRHWYLNSVPQREVNSSGTSYLNPTTNGTTTFKLSKKPTVLDKAIESVVKYTVPITKYDSRGRPNSSWRNERRRIRSASDKISQFSKDEKQEDEGKLELHKLKTCYQTYDNNNSELLFAKRTGIACLNRESEYNEGMIYRKEVYSSNLKQDFYKNKFILHSKPMLQKGRPNTAHIPHNTSNRKNIFPKDEEFLHYQIKSCIPKVKTNEIYCRKNNFNEQTYFGPIKTYSIGEQIYNLSLSEETNAKVYGRDILPQRLPDLLERKLDKKIESKSYPSFSTISRLAFWIKQQSKRLKNNKEYKFQEDAYETKISTSSSNGERLPNNLNSDNLKVDQYAKIDWKKINKTVGDIIEKENVDTIQQPLLKAFAQLYTNKNIEPEEDFQIDVALYQGSDSAVTYHS